MAIKFQIYRNEDDYYLRPLRRVDAQQIAKVKPGKRMKCELTEVRSIKADHLYFAAIDAAAAHWPIGLEPEPEGDARLLRAWLQCKAGPHWRSSADFPWEARNSVKFLVEGLVGDGRYAFVERIETEDGPKMRVHIPHSIRHDEMGEARFQPLRSGVLEQIEIVFGQPIKLFIEECRNADNLGTTIREGAEA